MMNEIFGVGFQQPKVSDWKEKFYEDLDDGEERLYLSKELHEHIDEGFSFKYRYAIEVLNRYWEKGEDFAFRLCMVIDFDSLTKEMKEGVMSCCGFENEDDVTEFNLIQYGGCDITFGDMVLNEDQIEDALLACANVIDTMDNLRGFFLDKSWNRIGSDGWDTIHHAIQGEDLFKPALNRMAV